MNDEGQQKRELDQEAMNGFNRVIVGLWDAGMKQERLDEIYRECLDACYQDDYLERRNLKQSSDHQQEIPRTPTEKGARNETQEMKTTEVSPKKKRPRRKDQSRTRTLETRCRRLHHQESQGRDI